MDGVTEEGGSINSEFWILNQRLAAGAGSQSPLFLGGQFYEDSVTQSCSSWDRAADGIHEQGVGPHTITLTHREAFESLGLGKWDSERQEGTSLVVQWLRIYLPNAEDEGSVSDQGTKVSHAMGQLSPHVTTKESMDCS